MKRTAVLVLLVAALAGAATPAASATPTAAPSAPLAVAAALPGPGNYGCWYRLNGRWNFDPTCWAWGIKFRFDL